MASPSAYTCGQFTRRFDERHHVSRIINLGEHDYPGVARMRDHANRMIPTCSRIALPEASHFQGSNKVF